MEKTIIKRGEIYWVELDPTRGSEIRKTRPCLIISNDQQNQISQRVLAILLTSQKLPSVPFHVSVELQGVSAKILPEQMRVIDKLRIKKRLGKASNEVLAEVEKALHIVLHLKS